MPANPLTLIDRAHISGGVTRNESCQLIGEGLGRCRTTISREIKRNGGRRKYCPEKADRRARRNRRRPKVPMLVGDVGLANEVQKRLQARDSPMRISIELRAEKLWISHETIYRAVQQPERGLERGLHKLLRLGRKSRKRQGFKPSRFNSLGIICLIHDRPQDALERTRFGHLEGDLIVGAMNRSALITVFDRKLRLLWLGDVASKSADDVKTGLCRLLARIPEQFRLSLTWDRGAELARHREIAFDSKIDIYFADPKSPWQRPTNENGNGLVRRHVGKGTDLSRFTLADLRHIESRINTIPRKMFDWETPQHKYDQLVAMTD